MIDDFWYATAARSGAVHAPTSEQTRAANAAEAIPGHHRRGPLFKTRDTVMFDPTTSISDTLEVTPRSRRQGLAVGHATHRGLVRAANEDDHSFAPDIGFFVVADGVGGAPGGAVAARLATAAMISSLRFGARWKVGSDGSTPPPDEETATHSARVVAAAHQAHQMIYSYGV